MGCTHAPSCPLFPKLNASLQGWRDAYCDSSSGWHSCARYRQSHSGQAVPLSLLPNGRFAHTIPRPVAAGASGSRFQSAPVSVLDPATGSPFEATQPAGTQPAATQPAATQHVVAVRPAASRPVPPYRAGVAAAPAAVPAPSPEPGGPVRRTWWSRLVEWMRSPA